MHGILTGLRNDQLLNSIARLHPHSIVAMQRNDNVNHNWNYPVHFSLVGHPSITPAMDARPSATYSSWWCMPCVQFFSSQTLCDWCNSECRYSVGRQVDICRGACCRNRTRGVRVGGGWLLAGLYLQVILILLYHNAKVFMQIICTLRNNVYACISLYYTAWGWFSCYYYGSIIVTAEDTYR